MKFQGKVKVTGKDPKMGILEMEIILDSLRSNKKIQLNLRDPSMVQGEGIITIEFPELSKKREKVILEARPDPEPKE